MKKRLVVAVCLLLVVTLCSCATKNVVMKDTGNLTKTEHSVKAAKAADVQLEAQAEKSVTYQPEEKKKVHTKGYLLLALGVLYVCADVLSFARIFL